MLEDLWESAKAIIIIIGLSLLMSVVSGLLLLQINLASDSGKPIPADNYYSPNYGKY